MALAKKFRKTKKTKLAAFNINHNGHSYFN